MKLDKGEILELEASPDSKILWMWFLKKSLINSIVITFFIFVGIMLFTSLYDLVDYYEDTSNVTNQSVDLENKEAKTSSSQNPFQPILDSWVWAFIFVGLTSVLIQIYLCFLRKTYRYVITNRRCIFIGGILTRVERAVPYKKITDIQRSQNIIERILGIWNVQIFTPGTASVQMGQVATQAELNYDGLINSEEVFEIISRQTQLH